MNAFDEWMEKARDNIKELLRNDAEEALFLAFLAGYDACGKDLAKFAAGLKKDAK